MGLWSKVFKYGLGAIILFSIIYYCISKPQLQKQYYSEAFAGADNVNTIGELTDGTIVEQSFISNAEYMKGLSVKFANYGNTPAGTVEIRVKNGEKVLTEQVIDAAGLPDSSDYYVNFGEMKKVEKGSAVSVVFEFTDSQSGSSVTLWASDKMDNCTLTVNGESRASTLVMTPDEYIDYNYTLYYCIFILVILIGWITLCFFEISCEKKGIVNVGTEFIHIFDKYRFLLMQLVGRDFKTKYRRSYLGILWSLLSPIFMMIIVSSVFSFIFRFNIENFPVYLILGQITFSFFSEATQISTMTIVGSGQLIKKVYLPKYIFPLSKISFSFINFLLSFIAVAGVFAYYRIVPTVNMIYLPLWLIEFYMFTLGVSMFLASTMVFLRDTQHLYSLVILAWGYITPIFYPVTSLSPVMAFLMNFNPLYHYIEYLRDILLYGVCPSLNQNIICLLLAVVSMCFGLKYFYKRQNKFILYI